MTREEIILLVRQAYLSGYLAGEEKREYAPLNDIYVMKTIDAMDKEINDG